LTIKFYFLQIFTLYIVTNYYCEITPLSLNDFHFCRSPCGSAASFGCTARGDSSPLPPARYATGAIEISEVNEVVTVYVCFVRKGIEDLCTKRDELRRQIAVEEEDKRKLQNDIRVLTERLGKVNESLSRKIVARNEFDRTIAETEAAYMKVCLPRLLSYVDSFLREFFYDYY